MSLVTTKSIIVKCHGTPVQVEATANAAITPGELIEIMSTGKVRAHSTARGKAEKMFAIENELEGEGINTDYDADAQVQARIFRPGDEVLALLAQGETAVIGSWLVSNGDGTLKVWTDYGESFEVGGSSAAPLSVDMPNPLEVVGVAMEALDLEGSSGEESSGLINNARLRVRLV